jgi:single-strand DNA-binding protein
MFNKIILVGNLTRDIELRYTQGGTAVSSTAIATSRKFKAQDGTQKEEVCFVDITFFGRTAEIANQYLKRGSKVLVEGRLKLDQWTDQSGGKRSKHTVTVDNLQMLGSRDDNNQGGSNYNQPQGGYNNNATQQSPQQSYQQPQQQSYQQPVKQPEHEIPSIDIDEDEIPF